MKKIIALFLIGIYIFSLIGFVFAQGNGVMSGVNNGSDDEDEDSDDANGKGIGLQVKQGTYTSNKGQEVKIQVQENNRLRIHAGNVTAECDEDCSQNMTQEREGNKTKLKVKLSNGKNAEIKVMPDVASEKALERLRLKVCSEENNCSIELKQVGKGDNAQLAYEIQRQRHFRILGMFQTKAQVKAQVNAETGEVIDVKKPWWAFLASEPEEEEKETDAEDSEEDE